MRVLPRQFLVKISKILMAEKKKLPGGLIVPETDESGRFSLQYGTIVQVGKFNDGKEFANTNFPEAKEGDTMVLHHWVETDADRVIKEDDEFIYVTVVDDNHKIKGVQKPDGTIIAHPEEIWCKEIPKAPVEKIEDLPGQWKVGPSGLFVFEGKLEDEKYLREKIDDLQYHNNYMSQAGSSYNPDIAQKIEINQKEGERITNALNKKEVVELELLYIHPETAKRYEGLVPGDKLYCEGWIDTIGYPLNFKGTDYILTKNNSVLYGKKAV